MGYAFISYSTKNQYIADSIRKLLNENKIDTWMAPDDIPAGTNYAGSIKQAIMNCACFVLLLTNDAQNSTWVANEVERAVNYRRKIITVQLENVVLNDEFEMYLSRPQIIAIRNIENQSETGKLLKGVIAYTGVSDKRTSAPSNGQLPIEESAASLNRNAADESAVKDKEQSASDVPDEPHTGKLTDRGLTIWNGVLRGYKGDETKIVLPSTIHTIADNAFRSNMSLKEIVIPDSVKVIGECAFAHCANLERVTFSMELEQIGERAFLNCKRLKSCTLPDSVVKIEQYAFQSCTSLASIKMSDNIAEIEEGTFFGCTSLVSVTLPKKLKTIRGKAFKDCSSLRIITLPEFVNTVEHEAFSYCRNLRKVTVKSGTKISPEVFGLAAGSHIPEIIYLSETPLTANDGVLVISSLESIPEKKDRPKTWNSITTLRIEEGIEELPMEAFAEMENLQRVELPQSLKKIGYGAFQDCPKLNNVIIPPSVTTISALAFERCTGLTSVTIPDSVKYIGDRAFLYVPLQRTFVNPDCLICWGNFEINNRPRK